ncbi:MAG: hypothetical protein HKL95_03110 [Phycisphaerae bacterium]|nr:hypothetical protein [Phycisphaerae bacterium]
MVNDALGFHRGGDSHTALEPLRWPEWFDLRRRGLLSQIAAEVPFFGEVSRSRRHVARQLQRRPASVTAAWGNDPRLVATAWAISSILAFSLGWPNDRFIPDDPTIVVFGGLPGTDLIFEQAFCQIGEVLGIPIGQIEGALKMPTFGEFVREVVGQK